MLPPSAKTATPFVKWVGGKRQLQEKLLQVFEQSDWDSSTGTYYEPFLGGGAVLFALMGAGAGAGVRARVGDINLSLLQTYRSIKTDFNEFVDETALLQDQFNKAAMTGKGRAFYLDHRKEFNSIKHRPHSKKIHKDYGRRVAALFLFLNKAGFNGLYRESRVGEFNVPFGNKSRVKLFELENLKIVRKVLLRTSIISGDYIKILQEMKIRPKKRDLIYFDPPYEPEPDTAAFTNYSHSGFNTKDQERLADLAARLGKTGCRIVISNSSAEHLRTIYWKHNFFVYEVKATRLVSAKSSGRKPVMEVIVTNFEVTGISGLRLLPKQSE